MENCAFEYPKPSRFPRRYRLAIAAVTGFCWAVPMLLLQVRREHALAHSLNWPVEIMLYATGGAFFGFVMIWRPTRLIHFWNRGREPGGSWIVISPESISVMVGEADPSTWKRRITVHRGKVRSLFRVPYGIGVSERSEFGARMLGFIVLPSSMPNFAGLKEELEGWKVSSAE